MVQSRRSMLLIQLTGTVGTPKEQPPIDVLSFMHYYVYDADKSWVALISYRVGIYLCVPLVLFVSPLPSVTAQIFPKISPWNAPVP